MALDYVSGLFVFVITELCPSCKYHRLYEMGIRDSRAGNAHGDEICVHLGGHNDYSNDYSNLL